MVRRSLALVVIAACSRGAAHPRVATSQRCTLRYHHGSLLLDGDPVTRDAAIEHCKALDGAIVMKEGTPPDLYASCSRPSQCRL